MLTAKDKRRIEFHLCGLHASEFEGDKSEVPTDQELKDFVIVAHDRVRQLHKGPHGERVRPILEAAVLRAGEADLERLRQQDLERRKK
jgi:hypothetical protein